MYPNRSEELPKLYWDSIICGNRGLFPFGTVKFKLHYMIIVSHHSLCSLRDTIFADNGAK